MVPNTEDKHERLAELLLDAQKGDQSALHLLCTELGKYVEGYFRNKFRNDAVIADLIQETHIRFLRNLPSVREPTRLRHFVVKVALHVAQDYLRQKYRRKEQELEAYHQPGENREQPEPMAESGAQAGGANRILNRIDLEQALRQLPEKSRQIILLKADGYNYEEIADEMHLSVSGVKMQVKRSLEKLKTSLLAVTFLVIHATIISEMFSA